MPKNLLPLLFCLLCCTAYTQQTTLRGEIYIHNSRYNTGTLEKVSNAFVTAPYGGANNTDSEGRFELVFSGVNSGATVAIKVEKEGYEVVNKKELLEVVIGRVLPLKIFLAPRGEITKAQVALYNISVEALTVRHNQIIAQLKSEATESQAAIKKLETQLNRTIADRFEAEEILNQQLEATRQRLPQFAKQLATVNLDFATDMYREAYGFLKAGEIEKAIEALDEAVLDREAAVALARIIQYREDIKNLDTAYLYKEAELKEMLKHTVFNARILQEMGEEAEALSSLNDLAALLYRLTPVYRCRPLVPAPRRADKSILFYRSGTKSQPFGRPGVGGSNKH
jgi:hypothetical protein